MTDNDSPIDPEPEQTDNQLLDWGLEEVVGGNTPPDLLAQVRASLARTGEFEPGADAFADSHRPTPPRGRALLLTAAMVLLGTMIVVAVAVWRGQPSRPANSLRLATDGQAPATTPLAQVTSLADAQALPADTRGVEAVGVDDATIAALVRLRNLEVLVVSEPWNESYGMSFKLVAPTPTPHITNACWQHFAQFTKLRALRLSGTSLVARTDGANGEHVITAIGRLPLLTELSLRCLDCRDDVVQRLPRLRQLRNLDLSFNHGFFEPGMLAIEQCRTLRHLSLQGCQQLRGGWLEQLHKLPELEGLDLSRIDGINWRNGTGEPQDALATQIRKQATFVGNSLQRGVYDATLVGLADAPKLRLLNIASGRWTQRGLRALGKLTTLRSLDMFGGQEHGHGFVADLPAGLTSLRVCGNFRDAFCFAVANHLTNLRQLDVQACYEVRDAGLAHLLAMPSLRTLNMSQMRGLTAASIDNLAAAAQLEQLDLRHNDFVTKQHIDLLTKSLPRLSRLRSDHE